MMRDIFICHASEDKQAIIRPLVAALKGQGVSCWVDEAEIKWADSITQKVNEGLAISRYVIVVLSPSFVGKNWPERELLAALNVEASSGKVKVLPLVAGDKNFIDQIRQKYFLLNDKLFISWSGDPQPIVKAVLSRLQDVPGVPQVKVPDSFSGRDKEVHLPKIRKNFSQRDRDMFVKEAFEILKDYFQHALSHLDAHYQEVDTDFTEIHKEKFRCKIYVNGAIKNECLIRIGGLGRNDSIGYSEGRGNWNIMNDNSFNEIIDVMDDGFELYLRFSMGGVSSQQEMKHFGPEEAAETLWKRFSSSLER
ncbi:MAG: toll/interleukin-1 receptor domain-containing protein [Chloroflexi bacterium]|nr:toll/interleukin-1 receptor domain-containing protein [Chloroflexota bacterium]